MTDWISDPNLSAEEKLERFDSLERVETRGPDLAMPCAVYFDTMLTAVAVTDEVVPLPTYRYRPTLPIATPEVATAAL
jgi:hypothetical protein